MWYIVCRFDFSWNISPLFHFTVFVYLLNHVGNEYRKFICIISYVAKYNFTVRPICFTRAVNFQQFLLGIATFTDSTAATSSRQGIDTNFFGVTLVLLARKQQCILSSIFTIQRQLAWPYPSLDASGKRCSQNSFIFPNPLGLNTCWCHDFLILSSSSAILAIHWLWNHLLSHPTQSHLDKVAEVVFYLLR